MEPIDEAKTNFERLYSPELLQEMMTNPFQRSDVKQTTHTTPMNDEAWYNQFSQQQHTNIGKGLNQQIMSGGITYEDFDTTKLESMMKEVFKKDIPVETFLRLLDKLGVEPTLLRLMDGSVIYYDHEGWKVIAPDDKGAETVKPKKLIFDGK